MAGLKIPGLPKGAAGAGSDQLSKQEKWLMLAAALRNDSEGMQRIPLQAQARALQAQRMAAETDLANFAGGNAIPARPAAEPVYEPPQESPPEFDVTEQVTESLSGEPAIPRLGQRRQIDAPGQIAIPKRDPVADTFGQTPSVRGALPMLTKLLRAGGDPKAWRETISAAEPDVDFVNGLGVDKRAPGSVGRFIPQMDKGQEPLFDANGRIVAIRNMDGSVQAAADMAGSVTGAQEKAKAGFDLVDVPQSDGSSVKIPRLQALERLGGGIPGPDPSAGPRAPRAPGAEFGRTQTPAEKARDEGRAKTQVEVEALTPKARSSLAALDRKGEFILETLRKARGQVSGGFGGSAGVNEITKHIPQTASRNLDATLDTLRANLGFGELAEMRQNSPTGGAVGSLTVRELDLLSALTGSLDQGQDPDQLVGNIDRMVSELERVRGERQAAFQRQYGQVERPAAGARPTPEQARAELARRRAARGQ